MDFDDSSEEAAYRDQVRRFLAEHDDQLEHGGGEQLSMPGEDSTARLRHSQAVLYSGGLVGVTWPSEYGGQGGTPAQQAIVNQELARADIAPLINHIGVGMCGPTVVHHGSEDQKNRYLARLLRADDIWCQLFSEPGSGSDLAALRTRAVQDQDGSWRVTGQKVWTTNAHLASYGILLARTNPELPKHSGLTMFVIDMREPGVTVRPLRQLTGLARFNEVYLDDVRIPDSERLGAVGDGWQVALTTLMNERLAVGGGGTELVVSADQLIGAVAARLPTLSAGRQFLARQELGRVLVETLAARYSGYRRLSTVSQGRVPGPEAGAGKLSATSAASRATDLGVRLLGDDALYATSPDGEDFWQTAHASVPGMAIAGGTNEILKNIIGERVLGLPREPREAVGRPFTARGTRS